MLSFWLWASIRSTPITQGLVPSPPPFEIRQGRFRITTTANFRLKLAILKFGNERIKAVQNDSYWWTWRQSSNFCVRKNLIMWYKLPYKTCLRTSLISSHLWPGAHQIWWAPALAQYWRVGKCDCSRKLFVIGFLYNLFTDPLFSLQSPSSPADKI